jgi:hypothetical protein
MAEPALKALYSRVLRKVQGMVETERIDTAVIEVIKLKQRTEGERAMNLTIEIPDDNAARYRRIAQARGQTIKH